MNNINDAYNALAAAIVIQAADDYRALVAKGVDTFNYGKRMVTREELSAFFNGAWCGFLIGGNRVSGSCFLNRLSLETKETAKKRPGNTSNHICRPVEMLDAETGRVIEHFRSVDQALRDMGISYASLRGSLVGKQKTAGGYGWRYADK